MRTLVSPRTGWRNGGSRLRPISASRASSGDGVSHRSSLVLVTRQDASSASCSATPASGSTGCGLVADELGGALAAAGLEREVGGVLGVSRAARTKAALKPGSAGRGRPTRHHRSALRATMPRDAASARSVPSSSRAAARPAAARGRRGLRLAASPTTSRPWRWSARCMESKRASWAGSASAPAHGAQRH